MYSHTQDTHRPPSLVGEKHGTSRAAQDRVASESPSPPLSLQKEERTMLEDIWVTLSELDNVTFSFKQLDENSVASE